MGPDLSATPLANVVDRLRVFHTAQAEPESDFSVGVMALDDPQALAGFGPCQDQPGRKLLWGLSATRIRVGPVLGEGHEACVGCLGYWLHHNREDAELWGAMPSAPAAVERYPWPPVVLSLVETASVDLLSGEGRRTFIDIDPASLQVERHAYLQAPGCTLCRSGADNGAAAPREFQPVRKPSPTSFRSLDLSGRTELLRQTYVDYRVGLVRHMYRDSTSDLLPMWGAEARVRGARAVEIGFGRNENTDVAESVAILEAVERFCGQSPAPDRTGVRASFNDLRRAGEPAVDPEDFILCPPEQHQEPGYALRSYSPELTCDWAWAFSCRRRDMVLVPQQMAFHGPGVTPPDELFVIETSNGCALGGSYEEAVFHGLLEAVERDAYMTRWHVKGRPQRIDFNRGPASPHRRLQARAQAEGLQLSAFSIGLEVPLPTVLAMIVDPRPDAPVKSYCASGAHPRAWSAINGALVEVCSSIGVYRSQFPKERDRARELLADASEVRSMRDHVLLYSHPQALRRLSFLDTRQEPADAEDLFAEQEAAWRGHDLTADLERLIGAVLAVASDVIVVSHASDVLRPLDLNCVKVLAPGLHPVTFGHQYRRISRRRLQQARRHLEAKGERCARSINPHPHNFP